MADNPAPAASGAANAPAAAPDIKTPALEIRDMLVAIYKAQTATPAQWDAIDAKIDAYQTQFGFTDQAAGIIAQLRNMELQIMKKVGDQTRYEALLHKLASDPAPQVAAMATDALAMEKKVSELKTKPMDLKFTDVDGKEVDLAKLRGKVVLLDFWATWCPPCREEVPNVVAAYKKYHDKGFEIVGVSLDQDKDKMLAYTKENGMTWPQYFDGEGWGNKISTGYDIHSIPAMWLIDKKGALATTEGRSDLDGQVAKLLAAP
jgi:thiol-disulfide isomerase/thioredoxin